MAGQAVDLDQLDLAPVDQDTPPVPRMDLEVRAGPCIQRGPSPVVPQDPAEDLLLAPRGPALAPVLVLVRPGLASVAQVA